MEKQMTADEVINLYQDFRSRKRLSDQYLEENGYETRKENDWDFVGDYGYGIVFLRDDCVDILIDEIYRLRERMKPKKVVCRHFTKYYGNEFGDCPNCLCTIEDESELNGHPHCKYCGQALDWDE